MKKIWYFIAVVSCLGLFFCSEPVGNPGNETGSIYGTVRDMATNKEVAGANVLLRPSGSTSLTEAGITGSNGHYEAVNVKPGTYTIVVRKNGYSELLDNFDVTVKPGSPTRRDMQIERLPSTLRLVAADGTMNDITGLNFGGSDVTRSFTIFNAASGIFDWNIVNNNEWISVNQSTGTLGPGEQQSIAVTIERGNQEGGVYSAGISIITTNSGSRDLVISTRSATLALSASPTIGGTATPTPAADFYALGSAVAITADVAGGYRFSGWAVTEGQAQIANANSASTTVILNSEAVKVTANFETVSDPGPGTGKSLAAQLLDLYAKVESNNEYIIDLTAANESIGAQPLAFSDGITNVTVRIIGIGEERAVTLIDNGSLFSVGAGVTLILDERVTLRGRVSGNNNAPLVMVESRGALILRQGAKISGNTYSGYYSGGGGVYVSSDAIFRMEGGEISGNEAGGSASGTGGGGVFVVDGGNFMMEGGKISGNKSPAGGGVYVANGVFMVAGGEITGNTASGNGGAVYVYTGSFVMNGGTVSSNTAVSGGGVYIDRGAFTIGGGEITGNTATTGSGGGVFGTANATVTKTGGVIYGYVFMDSKRNTASAGINSSDRGHAVFINSSPIKRRETTAGPELNLSSGTTGAAGGWE
ncbi:MAG: carboxypeptidase regulatory-like domain-containing protein [Chitinispirillia bacterium]|nr:carboxypeptidase regulatory-like domain-containing protein [Chitinispirillia bacterium]MCL2267925.1 carboxypeptidase regulatory-like domain-containing protein [Chitinispirillia bacterium]